MQATDRHESAQSRQIDIPRNSVYPWTPEEDLRLVQAVHSNQRENWPEIARSLPGRTSKQCWHRFRYHLRHQFHTGDWTAEEDGIILRQQAVLGNRWSQISASLPGRSENAVKNRWHGSLRHRRRPDASASNPDDPGTEDRAGERPARRRRRTEGTTCGTIGEADTYAEDPPHRHGLLGPRASLADSDAVPGRRHGRLDEAADCGGGGGGGGESSGSGSSRGRGRGRAGLFDTPSSPGRHARHRALLAALLGHTEPPPAAHLPAIDPTAPDCAPTALDSDTSLPEWPQTAERCPGGGGGGGGGGPAFQPGGGADSGAAAAAGDRGGEWDWDWWYTGRLSPLPPWADSDAGPSAGDPACDQWGAPRGGEGRGR